MFVKYLAPVGTRAQKLFQDKGQLWSKCWSGLGFYVTIIPFQSYDNLEVGIYEIVETRSGLEPCTSCSVS